MATGGTQPTDLVTEDYFHQKKLWPANGKHILAQYDEDTIIVYQAFKPSIAKYAVEHQQFGGPDFSFTRMSWIKTNFLWMMYRCGWATKHNQEHVLAVTITRQLFNEILLNAYSAEYQRQMRVGTRRVSVRLQWDPDHTPKCGNCQRRAIQLGLKGQMLQKYSDNIVSIKDITPFVQTQYKHVQAKDLQKLLTPRERVFIPDSETVERIGLDLLDLSENCPVTS